MIIFLLSATTFQDMEEAALRRESLKLRLPISFKKKITDVVLVVPNISNLRSDIELFARNNNTRFHLILANDPFIEKEKRNLPSNTENVLYTIAGASKFIIGWKLVKKYAGLLLKGKKAAWFFPSMAHPAAVMGAALGLPELISQYMEKGVSLPKHIFISGCTGT